MNDSVHECFPEFVPCKELRLSLAAEVADEDNEHNQDKADSSHDKDGTSIEHNVWSLIANSLKQYVQWISLLKREAVQDKLGWVIQLIAEYLKQEVYEWLQESQAVVVDQKDVQDDLYDLDLADQLVQAEFKYGV